MSPDPIAVTSSARPAQQQPLAQQAVPLEKILAMHGKVSVQLTMAEETIQQQNRQITNLAAALTESNKQLEQNMAELQALHAFIPEGIFVEFLAAQQAKLQKIDKKQNPGPAQGSSEAPGPIPIAKPSRRGK